MLKIILIMIEPKPNQFSFHLQTRNFEQLAKTLGLDFGISI